MLYADDAGIVLRSSEGLERIVAVIVTACSAFELTVSEAKRRLCACRQGGGGGGVVHHQCSRPDIQTNDRVVYLGGAISADRELSIEITRHLQRAWACLQRYKMEIYGRPSVRVRLKVRLLKTELIERLRYGCMTWSPNKSDYTGYDRFTTPCSFDSLDGGNGSAMTTPSRTPTRLPRQLPRA